MEQRLLKAGRWASDTALQLATGITKFFGTLVGEAVSGSVSFLWFVVLYCVVYVVMTPLLYVADNHEVALHEGIEVVELSEDVVNFGVDLGNVGLDALRPLQPLWNFGCYWARRVIFLAARVFIIAIEEVVEALVAPRTDDAGHAALIPGCRDGDWTTFADFDLQVCLFDFQSVGGWPEYAARSKIVTELTSLVHGDHSDSDEFWDAMLAYAGPHDPVHHPPDYYSDEEKREWWGIADADPAGHA